MPFSVSEGVDYTANKVAGLPFVSTMVSNPFYTAFLLAIIVVLTILWVFRDAEVDGLWKLSLRAGVYVLFLTTGVMYLHNRSLMEDVHKGAADSKLDRVFDISGGRDDVEMVPIPVDVNFAQ